VYIDVFEPEWVNEWHFLLSRPGGDSQYTDWQRRFPGLETLKVVIDFADRDGETVFLGEKLDSTMRDIADAEIVIRAKKVEVEVRDLNCDWGMLYLKRCEGEITKAVEDKLLLRED